MSEPRYAAGRWTEAVTQTSTPASMGISLAAKHTLGVVVGAATALATNWVVAAAYEDASSARNVLAAVVGLALSLGLQLAVILFVRSDEEKELAMYKQARFRLLEARTKSVEAHYQ